ncbi:hypothetical protein LINPERHAP1_LOCUS38216, partial [Linum perenne]
QPLYSLSSSRRFRNQPVSALRRPTAYLPACQSLGFLRRVQRTEQMTKWVCRPPGIPAPEYDLGEFIALGLGFLKKFVFRGLYSSFGFSL